MHVVEGLGLVELHDNDVLFLFGFRAVQRVYLGAN